jgi:hypothetical protein
MGQAVCFMKSAGQAVCFMKSAGQAVCFMKSMGQAVCFMKSMGQAVVHISAWDESVTYFEIIHCVLENTLSEQSRHYQGWRIKSFGPRFISLERENG